MSTSQSLNEELLAKEKRDPVSRVILASMIGTTIEFFDFYAYGTAASLYFPHVFFPEMTPTIALILSLLTFGVAFIARPMGSFIFGHFGDRIGRKQTLVASLLTMGISTVLIGCLPGYASIGMTSVILLCFLRFMQGIGLGGEWSGAASVATENAPAEKRARFGAFPQLGSPIGFFLCNGLFLVLSATLSTDQMMSWGWRVPFLVSAVLVFVGFWVRERLQETPLFRVAKETDNVAKAPLAVLFKNYWREIIQATFIVAVTYSIFYTCATWSLTYAVNTLGFSHELYLILLLIGVCSMAAFILVSTQLADRFGRRRVLMISACVVIVFAIFFPYLLMGTRNIAAAVIFLILGFGLMGTSFGPVGAILPELFPTKVRYSGAGIAYNLAAILGAAFLPTFETWIVSAHGVKWAGTWLLIMAVGALVALITVKETKDQDFTR